MWPTDEGLDAPTLYDRAPPSAGDSVGLRVVMLAGSRAGQVYEIEDDMLIGRRLSAVIRVDEPSVSREHARILRSGDGQLSIEDLASRNGTHVNGERIERRSLQVGDRINVGPKVILMLTLKDTLEEQRFQAKKLESIGRIAGGIAHDFNNLLAAILANVHYLNRLKKLDEVEVRGAMDEIKAAAEQGAQLTRQLLGFARRGKYEEVPVDVKDLMDEVLSLIRRTIAPSIEVVCELPAGLVTYGDRTQLAHVLMNLCINARDAMPDGGTLTIRARREILTQAQCTKLGDLLPGAYALLSIQDTGTGMDRETQRRIFEPFFTTKAAKGGTGLGLAAAYSIIDRHNGHIAVRSRENEGTIFRVRLALADQELCNATAEHSSFGPGLSIAGRSTVLLIDDDDLVRSSTAKLLRHVGFTVLTAVDGVEGAAIFADRKDVVTMVMLDWIMPKQDGADTFRQLRATRGDIPVLVCTGYSDEERLQGVLSEDGTALLRKPFDLEMLSQAMDEALGILGDVVPENDPAATMS